MMNPHQHDNHKANFQLERIALFSDAVFAIAITLLIIEIKVPEIHSETISDKELWHHFLTIIPKFIGFFISFFVIGLYWLSHHRLFKYVIHTNQKLLWNNLVFLLPIVLMPFSTSFLSEYFNGSLHLPLAVYTVNICLTGFLSFRLWAIVGNPKYNLSAGLDKVALRYNKTRAITTPVIFICILMLSFVRGWISYTIILFMPFVSSFIRKYYSKKYPSIMKPHLDQ